jgi:hypothetical protein
MLKIYVNKNDKPSFCVMLNNKDGHRFLRKFKGRKKHILDAVNYPNDFNMVCDYPKNYALEVFEYRKDDYEKAMDLMDDDL